MAIVCGTDFSPAAVSAATTAGQLAARLGDELVLVHALSGLGDELLVGSPQAFLLDPVKKQLEIEADRLRALGARVRTELVTGSPDEELGRWADAESAWLVVVGSVGKRGAQRFFLGSTSERTALTSSHPVLVVRGDETFGPWLRGERPLRIMLGADFSAATEAAVRRLVRFAEAGPCEIIAAQVVWPPELQGRYGLGGAVMDPQQLPAEAEELVERELRSRLAPLEGKADITFKVRPGFGTPAGHLTQLAERNKVDLLVLGTHQRKGMERARYGSVSSGVLHRAPMPVLLVPQEREVELGAVPRIQRVLAPTDFSELGDRATRMAYAQLPAGGVVRLLHVVERAVTNPVYAHYSIGQMPAGDEEHARKALSEALRALVPPEAAERGIATEVEVVESRSPATAIAQAAERFGADVICMGSLGRTGIRTTVLGSVAQDVLARTSRPLLLVRPPGESA